MHKKDVDAPFRRLILMEDVDPRFAELISVELNIPPEFWIAHCSERFRLRVLNDMLQEEGRSTYWKAPVPQTRQGPYPMAIQPNCVELGSFDRVSTRMNPEIPIFYFNSLVSFWGQKHKNGWTVAILVDPHKSRLRLIREQNSDPLSQSPSLPFNSQPRVDLSDFTWQGNSRALPSRPDAPVPELLHSCVLYDVLVKAYDGKWGAMSHHGDPFDATTVVRNLIFSIWNNSTSDYSNAMLDGWNLKEDLWNSAGFIRVLEQLRKSTVFNFDEFHYKAMSSDLRLIAHQKQSLRELKRSLLASNPGEVDQIPSASAIDNAQNEVAGSCAQVEFETRRWLRIDETLKATEDVLRQIMESFSRRAELQNSFYSHQQAQAADRQARSAGQLTKIATVAVPMSVASAVFSMGGEFAIGERLFAVYWAVSAPVTALLILWLIFSDSISKQWENFQKKLTLGFKKHFPIAWKKKEGDATGQ
ncbi:hypothetical protein CkaCkLH20_06823 [Colletotrichum karsti]|uniref:Uncharacterized protein n=1 Tax=Colletotrichum karsti TaxID=1095194 RepID=A0A9P6I6B2_9PEZI|nr:uncharacterized protein CkaCkLH20_06823 [Colletotrichum karsti]KAF9875891.1 hypothetical protein CkaCkLH20_06823 [Colletotrichum karsti]